MSLRSLGFFYCALHLLNFSHLNLQNSSNQLPDGPHVTWEELRCIWFVPLANIRLKSGGDRMQTRNCLSSPSLILSHLFHITAHAGDILSVSLHGAENGTVWDQDMWLWMVLLAPVSVFVDYFSFAHFLLVWGHLLTCAAGRWCLGQDSWLLNSKSIIF